MRGRPYSGQIVPGVGVAPGRRRSPADGRHRHATFPAACAGIRAPRRATKDWSGWPGRGFALIAQGLLQPSGPATSGQPIPGPAPGKHHYAGDDIPQTGVSPRLGRSERAEVRRYASPHSWSSSPSTGVTARSAAMILAELVPRPSPCLRRCSDARSSRRPPGPHPFRPSTAAGSGREQISALRLGRFRCGQSFPGPDGRIPPRT
jgi:hypothetical protein